MEYADQSPREEFWTGRDIYGPPGLPHLLDQPVCQFRCEIAVGDHQCYEIDGGAGDDVLLLCVLAASLSSVIHQDPE